MKCNKCGNENPQASKFCLNCGNNLQVQTELPKTNDVQNNEQNVSMQQQVQPMQQSSNIQQPTPSMQQSGSAQQVQIQPVYNEQPANMNMQNNNQYQQYNQPNMVQPTVASVSTVGTIILLVLCILSGCLIGIILSIVSLVMLSAANKLPDGVERNNKIKTGKTCRTVALVLYIIQAVIILIAVIVIVAAGGSFLNGFKDAIDNGTIIIDDGNDNINIDSSTNKNNNTVLGKIANKANIVTSGNGLYEGKDYYTEKKVYRYRSTGETGDVDNYIKFNDEIWRILSISEDGTMKLIGSDINSYYDTSTSSWKYNNIVFDKPSVRDISGTWCSGSTKNGALNGLGMASGCNLWAAASKGLINYKTDLSTVPVSKNSSLFDYLNSGEYWNNKLSSNAKKMMVKGDWYFGYYSEYSSYGASEYLKYDSRYDYMYNFSVNAYVGLINCDEVSNARLNNRVINSPEMTWIINMFANSGSVGGEAEHSFQSADRKLFTLNLTSETSGNTNVQAIKKDGAAMTGGSKSSTTTNAILPVVYISNKVKVTSGDGTKSNPYVIEL